MREKPCNCPYVADSQNIFSKHVRASHNSLTMLNSKRTAKMSSTIEGVLQSAI